MIDEEITLMNRFNNFNRDNPEVYELFKRFTFQAINKGHTRLSAWMIANRIRWETQIETVNDDYKIGNDYIALYSRKFMKDYPEHDGFFRTKPMKRL
tara:strand:+ start:254 stop:544 length:291 start_codon:yes stop_codon:yes gene_type:complete